MRGRTSLGPILALAGVVVLLGVGGPLASAVAWSAGGDDRCVHLVDEGGSASIKSELVPPSVECVVRNPGEGVGVREIAPAWWSTAWGVGLGLAAAAALSALVAVALRTRQLAVGAL